MPGILVVEDDEFSYDSMIGHLRMLMKLNRLNGSAPLYFCLILF